MTPAHRNWLLFAAPGMALTCAAVVLALESPSTDRLLNALIAGIGVSLIWGVAVAVQVRLPERPMGVLLFLLAGAYATQILTSSPNPLIHTLARAARPAVEVLLIWVMLAFPSGRLQGVRERVLVISAIGNLLLLWLPSVLFSEHIPIAGAFVQCQPDCPRNVLFFVDRPGLSRAFTWAFRTVGILILLATAFVLADRLRKATSLMRSVLWPVLVASIARVLTMTVFLLSGGFSLGVFLTFWAVPLAIALGLLRGRLYMARALQQLVSGMRSRPSVGNLREVMAEALDDPSLETAYWMQDAECWVDADGRHMALPYPTPARGRAVQMVSDATGRPVAALIHDQALLETPLLVEAVAGSMLLALESNRLDTELKGSRTQIASAAEDERHRIERDLHDGAQQRLIAMRMKAGVAARLLEHDTRRAANLLGELGLDIDAALSELRALVQGIAPSMLVESGLSCALREAAGHAAMPVRTEIMEVGRCDPSVERAVYFCCLEAMQNAAKHAGGDATVRLTLLRSGERLNFTISDDGKKREAHELTKITQGLTNMRERMAAVGGTLDISHADGRGFCVCGSASVWQAK